MVEALAVKCQKRDDSMRGNDYGTSGLAPCDHVHEWFMTGEPMDSLLPDALAPLHRVDQSDEGRGFQLLCNGCYERQQRARQVLEMPRGSEK